MSSWNEHVAYFTNLVIVILFTLSFSLKMWNGGLKGFQRTISDFQILPTRFTKFSATALMFGEVGIVLLLILGESSLGYSLAIGLLIIFTVGLISVLARQIDTSCNCFGLDEKKVTHLDVIRNLAFIVTAVIGLIGSTKASSSSFHLSPLESLILLVFAVVFVTVWNDLPELISLFKD